MVVLMIHCRYCQYGGEDKVFEQEQAMLRNAGVELHTLELDNDDIDVGTLSQRIAMGAATIWSRNGARRTTQALAAFRPDLAHFHNTFPQLSPSAWDACRRAGIPVVQTLHNYRLLCAAGTFLRQRRVCEACLPHRFHWAVRHRCYRDSRAASFAVTAMQYTHHLMGTYGRAVDRYISLTQFARDKFVQGGLPRDRVVVKPNSVPDPLLAGAVLDGPRRGALFVGRLSEEKGISCLIEAWKSIDLPLTVIGDGPMREAVSGVSGVTCLGWRPPAKVGEWMRRSSFLVVPSICYESLPMVIPEAYANGLPVLASRLGSLEEVVHDGVTGLHFRPGDTGDLVQVVRQAVSGQFDLVVAGQRAREEYLRHYTPQRNLEQLMAIYREVLW